jgi:hypothetical protein
VPQMIARVDRPLAIFVVRLTLWQVGFNLHIA